MCIGLVAKIRSKKFIKKDTNPRPKKIRLSFLSQSIPTGCTSNNRIKEDDATIVPTNSTDAPRFNANKGTVTDVMLLLRSDKNAKIATTKITFEKLNIIFFSI
jgi:hypothetical protein